MSRPRLKLYIKPKYYLWTLQYLLFGMNSEKYKNKYIEFMKNYLGVKHVIPTSMGRMAMYEGLRACYPEGGEIIVTPVTVPEVTQLIVLAGLTPVFADTKPGTWNIDIDQVEKLIGPETRAIIATHLYGYTNTLLPLKEITDNNKIDLVEDAAQALGGVVNGKKAGSFGKFSIFSHSYAKNVPSFYGGAVVTNDDKLAQSIKNNVKSYPGVNKSWLIRKIVKTFILDMGTKAPIYSLFVKPLIKGAYKHEIKFVKNFVEIHLNDKKLKQVPKEYKTQLSELQLKVLCDKLPEVDADVEHRIECAMLYSKGLENIVQMILPPFKNDKSHTYLYFPVEVPDNTFFIDNMVLLGSDVAYHHLADSSSLPSLSAYHKKCPNANRTAKSSIMLPTYPGIEKKHISQIVANARKFFNSYEK